ncbi:MAG: peptidoglycan DD-metalloendopeptidase family protein [Bacteroidales bacterium]|nr:peptidoglycan DD-metalloendopeptidase family protein [Bacteroidales bacterium]
MKKYSYLTILVLLVVFPLLSLAQDRPNVRQNKEKPKISANNQGIKVNKLVKTTDPADEFSGVTAETYDKKPKKDAKKDNKKQEVGAVDEADDAKKKTITPEPFGLEELPQERELEPAERPNRALERPGTPEEEYDEGSDIVTLPRFANPRQDDPGTESEDDILMAGDSSLVHTLKMDISDMQPVEIKLTDPEHGQYFVFPTPDYSIPTSHFGPRRRRFHYGLDLAMHTGEPIYAAFDGVVRFSKYNSSYGHLIVIRHDNGLETYYAHLSKRHVTPGTRVKAGEEIGLCGNTGRSRGSHLHFEIRYNGNALNPENVISCDTRALIAPTLTLTRNSFRKVAKAGASNTPSHRSGSGNYSSDGKYYKVRTGDTLSRIAKRNGTTISKLCKLNGLKETSVIRPGQKLRIR